MPKNNPKQKGQAQRRSLLSKEPNRTTRAAGKTHPGAGTLFDYKSKQLTGAGLAVIFIIAAGAGVFIWGFVTGWKFTAQLITPGQPSTGFSVGVWNGVTFEKLSNDDFIYDLYGTNDSSWQGTFTLIESGTSLDGISNGDLVDFQFFIVVYSGEVEIQNPKSTDSASKYIVPFYERQDQLFAGVSNTLYSYQEPSATGGFVIDSESILPVSSPIAKNVNISITVRTNATEINAAWVKGYDYFAISEVAPRLVVTFAGGVALRDFNIAGTTKSWETSGTSMSFSFDTINAVPQNLAGVWGTDITSGVTGITNIDLYFGDDLLANLV